ncbi:hydrogen peroxide-inducible genes activator [Hydrogenovibrio sp. 3SP14C1]|uniref:hydrogen peroxide-inducible genes activator n=1 Tax=Hydrogenovibrio sp. 3SP14C1 TaxID=3038774 RepID=UPI00241753E2|nr:hydrogen peroxide-inducible genes activator [Hydrogenovibrio sp. 3SP14C1]MDG4813566.1 hydrogen peroxide-inducible genes activator [Hydrogenovibrio sp. 3SP14C1]
MTLNELKYCVELANEKHFRKASEKCFVSQPTLSIAIKKLEEELNVTLFERRKNEVIITPIGKQVVELAKDILQKTHTIKEISQDEQSQTTELKIGVIYTIGPYLLPSLISKFHQKAQNIRLSIEENYTHILSQKLQSGELDIIIVSLPFDEPNIETCPVYEEEFVAAIPKNNPLSELDEIALDEVKNETVLLLGAGHCFRDQVLEAYPNLIHLHAKDNPLQRTLEGSSLETIRYMVASGAGITVLPCSACQNADDLLVYRPLINPKPKRTVVMAWRKSFPRQKVLQVFKDTLKLIRLPCTINPS